MLIRIGLETVIVIVAWTCANFFWPLVKRQSLLKKLSHDQGFLRGLTRDVLSSGSPPSRQVYVQKHPRGYVFNLLALLKSDRAAVRKLQLRFGLPLLVFLGASYFLGWAYLLVNLGRGCPTDC